MSFFTLIKRFKKCRGWAVSLRLFHTSLAHTFFIFFYVHVVFQAFHGVAAIECRRQSAALFLGAFSSTTGTNAGLGRAAEPHNKKATPDQLGLGTEPTKVLRDGPSVARLL